MATALGNFGTACEQQVARQHEFTANLNSVDGDKGVVLIGCAGAVLDEVCAASVASTGMTPKKFDGASDIDVLLAQLANMEKVCVVCTPDNLNDERVRTKLANIVPAILIQNDELAALAASGADGLQLTKWCTACTSHEFMAIKPVEDGNGNMPNIGEEFTAFCRQSVPGPPCLAVLTAGTYFVSLTFPDISSAVTQGANWKPPAWVTGKGPLHNALELRVDLLASQEPAYVLQQLSIARRHSQGLPIVFTVRSKGQGGAFPDDEVAAFKLMTLGLRFSCEYIDMECCFSEQSRAAFLTLAKKISPGTRVIGSYHLVDKYLNEYSDFEVQAIFHECAKGPPGSIDIVKVVGKAADVHCSIRIHQVALAVQPSLPSSVSSMIAICTTDAGRLSRSLNVMLGPTPVAHPALPGKAAPGQLSAIEIEQVRVTLGLVANPFTNKDGQ